MESPGNSPRAGSRSQPSLISDLVAPPTSVYTFFCRILLSQARSLRKGYRYALVKLARCQSYNVHAYVHLWSRMLQGGCSGVHCQLECLGSFAGKIKLSFPKEKFIKRYIIDIKLNNDVKKVKYKRKRYNNKYIQMYQMYKYF